jgi:hypothetical protein
MKPKFTKLTTIYLIAGGMLLMGFAWAGARGYKVFTPTGTKYHYHRAPLLIYHK